MFIGHQSLDRRLPQPDPDGSPGRCRAHAASRRAGGHQHGNKLIIETAQIHDPARDFQANPSLRQHGQRRVPLIEGLDQRLDGFPKRDKAIREALRPDLQAAIPGHGLKLGF